MKREILIKGDPPGCDHGGGTIERCERDYREEIQTCNQDNP